ncbi:MAG: hypothetical protein H6712_14480 [Myxococcales bacterium]|nr:hypothetical protein [Myxococcales bacterium]
MPSPLVITGYDPVQLDGSIDSLTQLQLRHGSNGLSSYGQSLEAEHDDLESPEATIRVKMPDFTYNGDSWEVTVSHQSGGNTISWSRDTDHAYRDLAAMTDALEVDVVATSNASPPVTKTRKVWIKTKPVDAQPDRP